MTSATTYIQTLRLHAPAVSSRPVRLRVAAQLAGADLRPPGLDPGAVLLVRQMPDPSPGRLRADATVPVLDRAWERAVRSALADALHRAARPLDGRVPPGADAVLFCDGAEAWACWSQAHVARPAPARAWWRQSVAASAPSAVPARQTASVHERLEAAWTALPEQVPAILGHLARWGTVAAVVESLTAAAADRVLRVVCRAHGVALPGRSGGPPAHDDSRTDGRRSTPPAAPVSAPVHSPDARQDDRGRRPDASPFETGYAHAEPVPAAPWDDAVRAAGGLHLVEELARLHPAHRQLAGVALVLHAHPMGVRRPTFQAAWRAWDNAPSSPSRDLRSDPPTDQGPGTLAVGDQEVDNRGRGERGNGDLSDALRRAHDGEASSARDRARHASSDEDVPPMLPAPHSPGEAEGRGPDRHRPRPAASSESSATAYDPSGPLASGERRGDDAWTGATALGEDKSVRWDGRPVPTGLAGAWYVVNVLEELGLPDAQETPPLGDADGTWALLEGLLRSLLGPEASAVRPQDALWRVLANLDGRSDDELAGRALEAACAATADPTAYRMPAAWLSPSRVDAVGDGRWTVVNGRLRVWTRWGCVADLRGTDDPTGQARQEWNRLPGDGALREAVSGEAMPRAHLSEACTPALARWAAFAAPYVRRRLAAALARDDEGGPAPPAWLVDVIHGPGTLHVTSTHVDVVRPLDAARLDVRRAGLDRSPGWLAAAGRVVQFHFREDPRHEEKF